MRAKPMILFIIALGCGLVASVSLSQYMEASGRGKGPALEMIKIYVAASNVNIGEQLDAQNVKLADWPRERVPEGAITNLDDLNEKFPRTRLYPEEPILQSKLMDRMDSPPTKIPDGYRVTSVKVDMEAGVAGIVQPGDRVDLVLVVKKSQDTPESMARTILKDVNVFAVNSATERTTDKEGKTSVAKSVSLLVKPGQVETIMLAMEMGKLQLALRRPNDTAEDDTSGATVPEILGKNSERTEDRRNKKGEGDSFVRWLQDMAKPKVEPAAQQAAQPIAQPVLEPVPLPPEPKKEWTMVVTTPSGHREFEWQDAKSLPREVMGGAPSSPSPAPAAFPIQQPPTTRPAEESRPVRVEPTKVDSRGPKLFPGDGSQGKKVSKREFHFSDS